MIMQPKPGREIIVTFKIVPSISRADATICIYFVHDAVTDRLVDLDYLEK
jgi:hypothetical protein